MSRILFVAYGGGHVAALQPVFIAARRAGHNPVFLALTTAKTFLRDRGIEALGFRDLPESRLPVVQGYGGELVRQLAGGPVEHDESVAYLGLNFRDLVTTIGEPAARQAYAKNGRQIFLPVATLKAAIEWINPDLVITTSAPRAERAAILAAGQLGLPSVCVVDLFCIAESEWVGKANYATRVCVLNEWVQRRLVHCGRLPAKVVITGNPAFDVLMSKETVDAGRQMRDKRQWNDGRMTVLWASQEEPALHLESGSAANAQLPRQIESALRQLVARHQDLRLVVRYHTSERVEFVPAERVEFSPPSESLAPLLHAVDAVVVMTSTVGLQAHIAGKRVVSVRGSVYDPLVPYADFRVAISANGPSDIETALGIGSGKLRNKTPSSVAEGGRVAHESSTERVIGVIESLI